MISVKCKITNNVQIGEYIRQYGSVMRYAYNRFFKEKKGISEVYHLCKSLSNTQLLDASFKEFAVMEAHQIFKSQETRGQKKVIFGGRKNFWKVKFHKEGKEILEKNKFFYTIGRSKTFRGNRKFNFDLKNNKVVFKPERNVKIPIEFSVPGNYRKLMDKAQELTQLGELPVSVKVSNEHIIFMIDESIIKEVRHQPIKGRVLAIDSNPQFIGISVSDEKKVIHKQVFDLRNLSGESSHKRRHETFSIAKAIAELAKHFRCELVGFEKLTIQAKDHKKGKVFNRKVNNLWNRAKFFENLQKWLTIFDISSVQVAPEYSSFIGQISHPEDTDSVAASLELGRRARLFHRIFIAKSDKKIPITYPELRNDMLQATRWKEMLGSKSFVNWKCLWNFIKKSKSSYRFLYDDWIKIQSPNVFRYKSLKSKVFCAC